MQQKVAGRPGSPGKKKRANLVALYIPGAGRSPICNASEISYNKKTIFCQVKKGLPASYADDFIVSCSWWHHFLGHGHRPLWLSPSLYIASASHNNPTHQDGRFDLSNEYISSCYFNTCLTPPQRLVRSATLRDLNDSR